MAKQFDKILGIIFLLIGILGYVPALTPDSMLFGTFLVGPLHNAIHILSGVILTWVGFTANESTARQTALAFGIIYGLVTVLGFLGRGTVLGMFAVNAADNVLHLLITVAALAVGLTRERRIPV